MFTMSQPTAGETLCGVGGWRQGFSLFPLFAPGRTFVCLNKHLSLGNVLVTFIAMGSLPGAEEFAAHTCLGVS